MDFQKYPEGTRLLFTNVGYFSREIVKETMRLFGVTPRHTSHLPCNSVFERYGKDYAICGEVMDCVIGWQSHDYWFGINKMCDGHTIVNLRTLYTRNKYIKKPKEPKDIKGA